MSANNTGGPAFPRPKFSQPEANIHHWSYDQGAPGMTLRDYFAAKALNACIREFWGDPEGTDDMAAAAYQIADAMLAEREKGAK